MLHSADQSTDDDEPAIFKSIDGGVKWKPAARGMSCTGVFALRADSTGTLLALGKDGVLWRSADGATTWYTVGRVAAKELVEFAIDPTNSSRMYVAMKESLHRSEDGGATFTASKLEPTSVVVDAKGTSTLRRTRESRAPSTAGKRGLRSTTG